LSYNERLASGKLHIFKITTNQEEATLSLYLNSKYDDKYVIDQLLGKCNNSVQKETIQYVDLWLNGLTDYIQQHNSYPLNKEKNKDLEIIPLENLQLILNLPFDKFYYTSIKDVVEDQKLFFYQLQQPEKGVIALKQLYGQWEIVLARNIDNCDMKDETFQILENWLWNHTPKGNIRQMKFNFTKGY
jgi:hypothetical protein